MRLILLLLFTAPASLLAQTFTEDVDKLNQQISAGEIDHFLKEPSKEGVPGAYLTSLVPTSKLDLATVCEEEEKKDETVFEVVLVGQYSSEQSSIDELPRVSDQLSDSSLQNLYKWHPETNATAGLSLEAVSNRSKEIWESGSFTTPSKDFDPKSALGRELLIESIVHAASKSDLNERDLTRSIAGIANNVYQSEQEKYDFLAAFSNRLYRSYNVTRNPGYNNSHNNPNNVPLPEGDMSLNDLMKGAAAFDSFQSGVCNDITEVVAQVGEQIFPDKDVLTINAGTHFGVIIADEEGSRIIDSGKQFQLTDTMMLSPKISTTNLRINKVVDGKQKEIAVVDTETGQLVEAAMDTGKNLLKTSPDINSLIAHLRYKDFYVSGGGAKLNDSNAFIVVAKYHKKSDRWNTYVGAGLSSQNYYDDRDTKYQVHFRTGVERKMFSYVNPKTEVSFTSGVRLQGMYGLNAPDTTSSVPNIDMSVGMDLVNRVEANYNGNVRVNSSLEVEHSVGPKNWGNTTGAISYVDTKGVLKAMSDTYFHLNQVNANVSVEKDINKRITAFTSGQYQGSNVGQNYSILGGLDIQVPDGAQLLVFTGYSQNLRGFQTQHSLLSAPDGFNLGATYKTKNDIQFSTVIRDVAGKPAVEAQIKVPIGGKKKR